MTILKDIISNLKSLPKQNKGTKPAQSSSMQASSKARSKELNEFNGKLDSILKKHVSAATDHIYLIDLGKYKEKLGEKWNKNEKKLHTIARSIIDRRLMETDLCLRYDDLNYLLVFPTLSANESQIKAAIISDEIATNLLGEDSNSNIIRVKEAIISEDGKVDFRKALPMEALFENILQNIDDGKPAIEEITAPQKLTSHAYFLDNINYIFRPMLAVQSKIVSTFMVLPIMPVSGGFLSGYDTIPSPIDHDKTLLLDCKTLRVACQALDTLCKGNHHSLLAIPVHFETMANHFARKKYLDLFFSSFSDQKNRIIIEIVGLPDGIPQVRLLEFVVALKVHARSVIARFDVNHTNFLAFNTAGLHAVGIDIFNTELSEEALMNKIVKFVSNSKKNQLKTYIIGVRSISMYTIAMTEGFDYMAGYALTETAKSAEEVYAFQLNIPYLSLLDSTSKDKI